MLSWQPGQCLFYRARGSAGCRTGSGDPLPAGLSPLLHFPLEIGAVPGEYLTATTVPSPAWRETTALCGGGVSSIGGETGEPTQLQWGWWGPALGVRAVGSAPVPSWAAAGQGLNPGDIPHSHSPGALSTGTGGLASLEFLWKPRYRTAWNSSNHLFFPYL